MNLPHSAQTWQAFESGTDLSVRRQLLALALSPVGR
jgi:hypothetical protein